MRLSGWISAAPAPDAATPRVMSVVEPLLASLGAGPDPECWVAWGDEFRTRWSVIAPTAAGLILAHVRVNVPQEGPRANGKLIRWPRVQVGEFTVETQLGHRIMSTTVEGLTLRGADATADEIGSFMQLVFAAIDGRAQPAAGGQEAAAPANGAPEAATASGAS